MASGQLLVFSRAQPGREDEFNEWYNRQHIPDVLRLAPEIRTARRYSLTTLALPPGSPTWAYVTIYDIAPGDVGPVLERMNQAMGTPRMPLSDTAELSSIGLLQASMLGEPFVNS
jgi:hypothetical protein